MRSIGAAVAVAGVVFSALFFALVFLVSSASPASAQQCPNDGGSGCVVTSGTTLTINTSPNLSVGGLTVQSGGTLSIVSGGGITAAGGISDGAISVTSGGALNSAGAYNFGSVAGNSSVTVDASTLSTNTFNVGAASGGIVNMTFTNGAQISSSFDFLAIASGSAVNVTLSGAGTVWNDINQSIVGQAGTATLTISGGAQMNTQTTSFFNNPNALGDAAGSNGTLKVTGAGSFYYAEFIGLVVGNGGTGTLIIADGATVNVNYLEVAAQNGSVGRVIIGAPEGQAPVAPGTISPTGIFLGGLSSGGGDAAIIFNHTSDNYIFNSQIAQQGSAAGRVIIDAGTTIFTQQNYYTGGTFFNGGTLYVSADSFLGDPSSPLNFNGGILKVNGTFTSTARTINWGAGGGGFDVANPSFTVSQQLSGPGGLAKLGAGFLTLSGANSYTGATNIQAGTLIAANATALGNGSAVTVASGATLGLAVDASIGSLAGAGTVGSAASDPRTLSVGGNNTSTTFSGTLADNVPAQLFAAAGTSTLSLVKEGTGTLVLSGISTYTGATTINGGTLEVDGSIASSSNVTVNAGGMLSGSGIVDPATTNIMSGATLAPGSAANPTGTLGITGNLAFASGAIYLVQVTPTAAASANVAGTATLGGATVNAAFANGGYISRQYTILTAGSISGTFGTLSNTNLPSNFSDTLSYDSSHAYLNLTLSFTPPTTPNFGGGLNINQQHIANTLVNFFNTTGGIPTVYGTLAPAGLTQASGESATGSQQTTFDAMNLFMGLLTDPFTNHSGGGAGLAPGVAGYADDQASAYAAGKKTDAYAMFTKAPPPTFEQRWSVWAAGYGGSQSTSGNAGVGSNDTTSRIAGTAVGADYLFSPDTLAGFALAGGGTNFSVNTLGGGRSDLFQAGAYIRHTEGNAYISGALAYGWQDITTDRTVTAAGFDQLRAEFNANAYSGRMEGGYRLVAPWIGGVGLTPYAAGAFTTFDLPAYAERVLSGASAFALNYAAKDVTDTRSELGIRGDKSYAVQGGVLTLRGRLAWAHDYDPDRSLAATFQALPGTSFVVNGAAQASDSALTTASIEMKWMSGWSAAGTFEGEFSNVTASYAGKGVVRYAW